nr:uncharacterized protein LOC111990537 [Quercus suber]
MELVPLAAAVVVELAVTEAESRLAVAVADSITAASLAAAMDLSWANISRSLLILFISCALQASSRTIRSRSLFSMASKNLFCKSSCFSMTSFISLSKKSFHFLFFLRRSSNCSSEEVEEESVELEIRSAEMFWKDGIVGCEGFVVVAAAAAIGCGCGSGGGGKIVFVGFVGGNEGIVVALITGCVTMLA